MRTIARLQGLKKYVYETVCKGREMKAPAEDMDITEIVRQEPQVFLGWNPTRMDETGMIVDPINVCPGILIMPSTANVKNVEEKRFDRYNNVKRSQDLGQWLNVSILFSVYEPGVRLPGFVAEEEDDDDEYTRTRIDVSKIKEGTEEGLTALMNWMDDLKDNMIADQIIPGTDLILDEQTFTYSPYVESGYVVDKRPIYYGFISVKFQCYAENKNAKAIDEFLE